MQEAAVAIEIIVHGVEKTRSLGQRNFQPLPFFRGDNEGCKINGPWLRGVIRISKEIVGNAGFTNDFIQLVPIGTPVCRRPMGESIEPLLPVRHDRSGRIHHFVMDAGESLIKDWCTCGGLNAVFSGVARQSGFWA